MKLHKLARITAMQGVEDDFRGRSAGRSVVVLTREGWETACRDLGASPDWTTRRANLLIEGVNLTWQTGKRIRVGEVLLEVTGECEPCHRMEAAVSGLWGALESDWRAGVTCIVISEGTVAVSDAVAVVKAVETTSGRNDV